MEKVVEQKWETEGDLAVIYRIENILLFYTKELDPYFRKGQKISLATAQGTNPYKAIAYHANQIPSDAYPSIVFSWGA